MVGDILQWILSQNVLDLVTERNPKLIGAFIKNVGFAVANNQGMKMAIFDVSDVSHPVEMHKIIIGDRGTESYALRDHKAFLFDKSKNLLVLPIELHLIPENLRQEDNSGNGNPDALSRRSFPQYGEAVFQGAFVYKITLEDGFEERGRITHITQEDELKMRLTLFQSSRNLSSSKSP